MKQSSLRLRLLLLVLVAVVPLFGISVYWAIQDEEHDLDHARTSLQAVVASEAVRQGREAESARLLLVAMAHAADVRAGSARDCQAYMESLRESFPAYNAGVLDLDGTLRCSIRSRNNISVNTQQIDYFQEAIRRRGFAIGGYMAGLLSGRPVLGYGYPVTKPDGVISGVAFAAIRLEDMHRGLRDVALPDGGLITVLDRHARVLASTDPRFAAGAIVPVARLKAAALAGATGVEDAVDPLDGVARIHAFTPARGVANAALFIIVGVERGTVIAAGRERLISELAGLAVVTLLGAWLAWLYAGRQIVRPTREILEATSRLRAGHLGTRLAGASDSGIEFARISAGLNQMAQALEERERALREALEANAHARATQDLILNTMQESVVAIDTDRNFLLFNEAAARIFLRPQDASAPVPGQPRLSGIFRPGTQTLFAAEELPLYRAAVLGESGSDFDMFVRNELAPEGRLLRGNFRPIRGPDGIIGGMGVFTDITKTNQLEADRLLNDARLRETQRRLLDAQRIGRIANWESDPATRKLWWSDEVYELFGVAHGEFDETYAGFVALIHPDDRAALHERREAAINDTGTLDTELRIVTPMGEARWMHIRGEVRRDDKGQPLVLAGVVQDISARKADEAGRAAAEQEIKDNAERLARLVEVQTEFAEADVSAEDLMDRMAALALCVTGGPGAEFELMEGDDFVLRSSAGTARRPAGARRKRGQLSREAIRQARVVRCDDSELDARVDVEWCRRHGVRSLMGGALRVAGVPVGGLVLLSGQAHGFSRADAHVLELLCEFLGALLQRKQAEQALRNSEQRYAVLFDAGPVPMWVFDPASLRFLAVNEAAVSVYGFSREEFLAMTLLDIRPEEERRAFLQRQADGFRGVPPVWKHRRKDGSVFPAQSLTREIRYGDHNARFALAFDVTERVEAEKAIAEQIFVLQRAADAAEAIVSHRSLQGTLQEVVDQLRGVIGAHQAFVTVVADGKWDEGISVASLSERDAPYRHQMQNPDGSGIYAEVCESNRALRLSRAEMQAHPHWKGIGAHAGERSSMHGWLAVPLVGRDGKNMGVMQLCDKYEGEFTLQDEYVAGQMAQLVSVAIENARLFDEIQDFNRDLELKVVERSRALARQEAVFRAVADQAPQVMWIVNPKGAVTYLNRYWYELVGGAPPKWLGHEWTDAVDPEDVDEMRAKWKVSIADHSVFTGLRRVSARDGTIHTLAYRASPVHDDTGTITCWVGLDADITESKLIEAALREANQELETFSYSVSHDLRSPLNTIDGFSRLLEKDLKANEGRKADHYLSRIQAAAGHMGELIEGLLALAQVSRQHLRMAAVDLSAMSEEVADRLRRDEPDRLVRFDIEPGMSAAGDARLLRALLQNLIGNAWKFSSKVPQAEISLGCITARAKAPVFFVRDNGAGFDMQYAGKLFGTFQRLHGEAEFSGTGIGLATVKRIVTRHGGAVWAESRPGQGATFFFTLNAPDGQGAAPAS